jgi:hypothetical protein
MLELLPCPFCGSTASFTEDQSPSRDKIVWLVGCDSEDCPAMPLLCGNARKVDAAKAWNTRAASVSRKEIVEEAFEKGRDSVVFEPHSAYRDLLRQMICEGDFDFTKIFEEIEDEGESYTDISNEGADALADYFIGLMEQIDERRSNESELNRREAMDAYLAEMEKEK